MATNRKSPPRGKDPARGMVKWYPSENAERPAGVQLKTEYGWTHIQLLGYSPRKSASKICAAIRYAVERDRRERGSK